MVGLKLHQVLLVVVDQNEANRSVSTEGGLESEEDNVLLIPFELVDKLLLEIGVGDIGFALVEHLKEDFLPWEEFVDAKLLDSHGDGHKLID